MEGALDLYPRNDDTFIYAASSAQPYTTPALAANIVFRFLLGLTANFVCLVPLRLLHRNGELAAAVFIANIELQNLHTIVYSLIWRHDDMENWWPGYGLCDVGIYFQNFSTSLFATCMLAIMRNLAHQVGLLQANPLTVKEKRRRNLVQVLIMLPLPLAQLVLTWLLMPQRYAVGTLIGCSWISYASWQYLVFFILAPVVVSLITVSYAVLTYTRFREVSKTTESALSSNRVANYRAQRTRRRLYLMVVSILVPFFPIVLTLAILNIKDMGPMQPYNYDEIHNHEVPSWGSIIYMPSNYIPFSLMNIAYIPILTSIAVFIFFGLTKDAMDDYRKVLLFLCLGRVFPRLYREYDPGRPGFSDGSFGSSQYTSQSGSTNPKFRVLTSSHPLSTLSSHSSGDTADQGPHTQSLNFITSSDMETGQAAPLQRPQAAQQPSYDTTIHRNPFLVCANLDLPIPFNLRSFFSSSKDKRKSHHAQQEAPLETIPADQSRWTTDPAGIHTRVWSDEEHRLCTASNDDDTRSISSEQGVHVETLFTRETHETHRQQR